MATLKEPKPVKEKFGFTGGNALQVILDKLPDAVTKEEKDILRARRDYLTEEQIKRFGLEEEEEKEVEASDLKEETPKEKKAREKAEKAAAKKAAKEK